MNNKLQFKTPYGIFICAQRKTNKWREYFFEVTLVKSNVRIYGFNDIPEFYKVTNKQVTSGWIYALIPKINQIELVGYLKDGEFELRGYYWSRYLRTTVEAFSRKYTEPEIIKYSKEDALKEYLDYPNYRFLWVKHWHFITIISLKSIND